MYKAEEGKNDDPAGMEPLSGLSLGAVDKIIGEETEENYTLRLARNILKAVGVE